MRRKVTLISIAEACNVKPATVSRVLNNVSKGFSVSDEKRSLIKNTARDMGYIPNLAAQNLRLNRTNRIMVYGLTAGWGILETTYSHMLTSCVNKLNDAGFEVDVVYPASKKQIFSRMAFDGAVIVNPGFSLLIDDLKRLNMPYVIMNDRVDDGSSSYVAVDDFEGMKLAFEHLNRKGHTKIAYRCSQHCAENQKMHRSISDRHNAYKQHMDLRNFDAFSDYETAHSAHDFIQECLQRKITAIITYDVTNSLELLKQCAVEGLTIPEDLSILTFNEPSYPTFPELSSISLPLEKMGDAVAGILIAAINGEKSVQQRIFSESLIERNSIKDLT